MAKKEHSIWVERFRTDTLDNYVCSPQFKQTINEWITTGNLPHITLYGRPGVGKTTLGKLIIANMDCDSLYINASEEGNIDVIRTKVKSFVGSASFRSIKIVLLDEASHLTPAAQQSLLNMIETYSENSRFILTSNFIDRLIPAMRSRCTPIQIYPPSKKDVALFAVRILDEMEIKYKLEDVAVVLNKFYPDIRSIISHLQLFTLNKELNLYGNNNSSFNVEELVSLLKQKSWVKIREKLSESSIDYDELYSLLYTQIDKLGDEATQGMIIIHLAEYQYKQGMVPDKEINIMACISQIIKLL